MLERIYISEKALLKSLNECLGAWEAFDERPGIYRHPRGRLLVFRRDGRLFIMRWEEMAAKGVVFKIFDLRVIDDLLFLLAAAHGTALPSSAPIEQQAADDHS